MQTVNCCSPGLSRQLCGHNIPEQPAADQGPLRVVLEQSIFYQHARARYGSFVARVGLMIPARPPIQNVSVSYQFTTSQPQIHPLAQLCALGARP